MELDEQPTINDEGTGCPESKQGLIPRPTGSTPAGVILKLSQIWHRGETGRRTRLKIWGP